MRLAPFLASALALSAAASVAGAAEDGPILPGWWESTSKVAFPFPSSKTERKCVSSKAINAYLTGPSNPHYTCHYDTRHVADGRAEMAGECIDNNGFHSTIKVTGAYTPTSFDLDGHLQVLFGGLRIPITASIAAHRLSEECPAGAKVEGGNDKPPDGAE
jgi:hypothetical protein